MTDIDYKRLFEIYEFDKKFLRKGHTCRLTKNMMLLLDALLSSVRFTNNKFDFNPDKQTIELLNEFCDLDIIDTYERLGLDNTKYGTNLVNKSKNYVLNKMIKIRAAKHE